MAVYYRHPTSPKGFGINIPEMEIQRNPYCSISDVEEWIHRYDLDLGFNNAADYEYWVGKAIRRAERAIDAFTMTTFHKVKRREWHSGTGEQVIILDCYPPIEVTKVQIYSAGFQTSFEYEGDDMVLDNEAGSISFPALYYTSSVLISPPFSAVGYVFLPGNKNVMIEYWYGYDKVPDTGFHAGIRDACAMWAASLLLSEADARQAQGLMSLNVEGQGTQYGRWEQRAQMLKQEAMQMAKRYRRQLIRGIPI